VDGESGVASVQLPDADAQTLRAMAARTMSDPDSDPLTGAELGMGMRPNDIDKA
jgi:Mn-containing catalase